MTSQGSRKEEGMDGRTVDERPKRKSHRRPTDEEGRVRQRQLKIKFKNPFVYPSAFTYYSLYIPLVPNLREGFGPLNWLFSHCLQHCITSFPVHFPTFTKSYNSETHFPNVPSASMHRAKHITVWWRKQKRKKESEQKGKGSDPLNLSSCFVLRPLYLWIKSCTFCSLTNPCQAMVQRVLWHITREREREVLSCFTIFDILYTFVIASRSK